MAKKKNNNQLGFDKGRQILCDQRNKTLVAVLNHLKSAPITDWCEIHEKYSRIQLLFQDYSVGKGDKSKFAKVNLTAPEVKSIYHCVSQIYPLTPKLAYKERFFKEFNDKFSELTVERTPEMRIPWCMTCTVGDCDKDKKPIKGTETKIMQRYNDIQMFQFWSTVNSFVCNWESATQIALQRKGAPLTKKALEEEAQRANGQQSVNQGNNSPVNNQQPYNRNGNNAPAPAQPQNGGNRYENNSPANSRQSYNRNGNTNTGSAPAQQPSTPPPPPGIAEEDIPFNEMPNYGAGYGRIVL